MPRLAAWSWVQACVVLLANGSLHAHTSTPLLGCSRGVALVELPSDLSKVAPSQARSFETPGAPRPTGRPFGPLLLLLCAHVPGADAGAARGPLSLGRARREADGAGRGTVTRRLSPARVVSAHECAPRARCPASREREVRRLRGVRVVVRGDEGRRHEAVEHAAVLGEASAHVVRHGGASFVAGARRNRHAL